MEIYELDDGYKKQLLDLTCDLVRIPTENHPPYGDEAAGQEHMKSVLSGMGLEIDEFSPADLPDYAANPEFLHRELAGRNDIVGTWRGSGGGRSLVLSGHMDVAPKEPMRWEVCKPFTPVVRDGKLYGRGAADMKGGIACAALAIKMLKERGFVPRGDVIIETVVDEEYAGANGTIASRLRGHNADFGIDLEPSGLNICPACVGGLIFKLTVTGIAGMPYTGEEIGNPIYDIMEVVRLLGELEQKRRAEHPRPQLWADSVQGLQVVLTKLKAGETQDDGQLSTPIDAWVEVVLQTYPEEQSADAVERELTEFLRANYANFGNLTIEREYHYCRPAAMDADHEAVTLLANSAAPFTDLGVVCGCLFSCDLFAFHEIGDMPAVVFGPVGGRLHAPDEWVDIASMEACAQTLAKFITEWCK